MYFEQNGAALADPVWESLSESGAAALLILEPEELDRIPSALGISPEILNDAKTFYSSKLESRDGAAYLTVRSDLLAFAAFVRKNLVLLTGPDVSRLIEDAEKLCGRGGAFFLDHCFDLSFAGNFDRLEVIEEAIAALEERIAEKYNAAIGREIMGLRKTVMRHKICYERLSSILEELIDNEDALFSKKELQNFRVTASRIERLYQKSLNLQEQIAQAREAYQAQMDISLNANMRVLTLVSIFFMPLTLLVGWYGMNLRMPEFNWALGYPFVIGIAIVIIVILLMIYRKNRWF